MQGSALVPLAPFCHLAECNDTVNGLTPLIPASGR